MILFTRIPTKKPNQKPLHNTSHPVTGSSNLPYIQNVDETESCLCSSSNLKSQELIMSLDI